jgi:hypothetical protein
MIERHLHISLSSEQLQTLLAGASRVPPQWRRRFVDGVAALLIDHLARAPQLVPPITDDETVSRAVNATLHRIGLAPTESAPCHD